jgi:hypothetical protein
MKLPRSKMAASLSLGVQFLCLMFQRKAELCDAGTS